MKKPYLNKEIEKWVSNFGYSSIEEWIEKTAENILYQANQRKFPIQLQSLFRIRKILRQEVQYLNEDEFKNSGLGELRTEKTGFVIVINRSKKQKFFNRRLERFTIAHEIAHTFFYDFSKTPPKRFFSQDRVEEGVCNRLAAALLMPKDMVQNFISCHFKSLKNEFRVNDFRTLFISLMKNFDVNAPVVARRLIEDLGLLNMIVLGGSWQSKNGFIGCSKVLSKDETLTWRVAWYTRPSWTWERLFIPSRGFPKIRLEIVENLYNSLRKKFYFLEEEERLDKFRLGNLEKFLKEVWGLQERYPVYVFTAKKPSLYENLSIFSLTDQEEQELDFRERRAMKPIVCIPLPTY